MNLPKNCYICNSSFRKSTIDEKSYTCNCLWNEGKKIEICMTINIYNKNVIEIYFFYKPNLSSNDVYIIGFDILNKILTINKNIGNRIELPYFEPNIFDYDKNVNKVMMYMMLK